MHYKVTTVLAIGLLLSGAAQAAKVPLYDDFSGDGIDRAKWVESESARFVDKQRAFLGRRLLGGTSSDSGVTAESFSLNMQGAAPAKSLKADITVDDIALDEVCASNPTPSRVAARLIGAYFNVRAGGPVPGDRTGDVLAQLRAQRLSNSLDAPGVLQVQAVVSVCTNADCSTSNVVGAVQNMGTVTLGTKFTAQIDWDRAGKVFNFTRDKGVPVSVAYTDPDNVGPSLPFNNISLRNETANCLSGPRVKAGLSAYFDNVGLRP
jgi:hypothetical protein